MKKIIAFFLLATACNTPQHKTIGTIQRLDPELDAVISETATVDIIAEGHDWSEGPVWVTKFNMLLYSDVPRNTIYQWTAGKGVAEYLHPSGFTGSGKYSNEPGSNGLLLDAAGYLVLCQHGDRRLAMMDAALNDPEPVFTSIADNLNGKKFNSPNDVTIDQAGNFYFTDPPYGLPQQEADPTRELSFQGVYKVDRNGTVSVLIDSLTRPNGIALTHDNKYLIVANSDPQKARWYKYELSDTAVVSGSVFYDATAESAAGAPGLPDGLKIDSGGYLFASGPGGVSIFNPNGKRIGLIKLAAPTSNTALSSDEKTLFITNDMYVLRVKMRN